MKPLTLLLDTNVFIACANIHAAGRHDDAEEATELVRIAREHSYKLALLPATRRDLLKDSNPRRRSARLLQIQQWDIIDSPFIDPTLKRRAGYPACMTDNDEVDLEMIAALDSNAVDVLVTQDRKLRDRASQAGYHERVMSIRGAIEYLRRTTGRAFDFPTVEEKQAHALPRTDPIFDSLRKDYPDFDNWFSKACLEQRRCYVIQSTAGRLEALAILKDETDRPHDLKGKVLKICTMKVADDATGAKRGELLLRSVFHHAARHDHDALYVEVFEHHRGLIELLGSVGFEDRGARTARGELVLVKGRRPTVSGLSPLEYHIRYGPPAVCVETAFVVPVQPRWHDILFPELAAQPTLLGPGIQGNGILKAYLSKSPIRTIDRGAVLLFYRSEQNQGVTAVGVVDGVLRSDDPAEIRRFVGQRTVYSDHEIAEQCAHAQSGVLALRFRHDRALSSMWSYKDLLDNGVLAGRPQSIQQVKAEALPWLRQQLSAAH